MNFTIKPKGRPNKCSACHRYKNAAINEHIRLQQNCPGWRGCAFGDLIVEAIQNALKPVIHYLRKSAPFIKENTPIRISWEVEKSEQLFINHEFGEVTGRNFIEFVPEKPMTLELKAVNGNFEISTEIKLEAEAPEISTFQIDKDVIPLGENVKLSWKVEGFKRLLINDTLDVTNLTEVDFNIDSDLDSITLTAIGDFDSESIDPKPIHIAKVNDFRTNNPNKDIYQLSWGVQNFKSIKIHDEERNVLFEGESNNANISIPSSNTDVKYYLTAITVYNDLVSQELELKAVRVHQFKLKNSPTISPTGLTKVNFRIENPNEKIGDTHNFQGDTYLVYEDQPLEFEWFMENTRRIEVNGGIGEVDDEKGTLSIEASDKIRNYTITAYGDINYVSKSLRLQFVKLETPSVKSIPFIKVDIPSIEMKRVRNDSAIFSNEEVLNISKNLEKKLSGLQLNMFPNIKSNEEFLEGKIKKYLSDNLSLPNILREINEELYQQSNNDNK